MTQESTGLQPSLIAEPRLWRLYVMVAEASIDVLLYNLTDDNGLIAHHIALDATISNPVKRLEEAVYQNPLLLADFSRVSVLLDTDSYMMVPAGVGGDPELLERCVAARYPDAAELSPVVSQIPGQNAAIVGLLDPLTLGFLRRTFNNPVLNHRLYPLCRYFLDKSRIGSVGKMYAHLSARRMDLMVFGRNTLRMTNTFALRESVDAAYYILAARKSLELDNSTDELILSGERSVRDSLMPMLREYIACVMPAIYPSAMFRAEAGGRLDSPFELIVMPLCE